MAWTLGGYHIGAGQTMIHWFHWGSNAVNSRPWQGIQVCAGKPVATNIGGGIKVQFPATLRMHDPDVIWTVEGYTYRVQITNLGPFDTEYELTGGGV